MLNLKRYLRSEKGFTMIEMMVVLIIIAVLIGGGIKFYSGYIGKSKITKAKAEISTMQAGLDSYYAENNDYPGDDTELGAAGLDTTAIKVNTTTGIKYNYKPGSGNTSYTIISNVKLDGTNYVKGTGADGKSEAPVTTTTY